MPFIGIQEINSVRYEIHANASGGWQIREEKPDHDGRVIGTGSTLDAAINNARQQINREKVKIAVNFVTHDGERGVATGRHGRNRTILVRVNGKAEQWEGYRVNVLRPDIPKDDIDRLLELDERIGKLQAEKREIVQEWKFDLDKAVDEAIQQGMGASA